MKKLFIYLKTFIKTFFRQLFNSKEIEKVELENTIKKQILEKPKETIIKKFIRKGNIVVGRTTDALPRIGRPCLHCGKDMKVSIGQLAYWHKECRTEGRRLSINARYGRV